MSLIVYDEPNLNIILHDPSQDLAVVHDSSSNSFQLINTRSLPAVDPASPKLCPHCGSTIRLEFKRRDSNVFNNRFNRGTKYVNNNYFKLLAEGMAAGEEVKLELAPLGSTLGEETQGTESLGYSAIPGNLFTPNYFGKFFKIIDLLGKGSSGYVYKVEHFINNYSLGYFAVKKIPIGNDAQGLDKILKEVELFCLLSTCNQNLVKYNHVWLEISQMSEFGPPVPCAFILTEYCDGGNLQDMIDALAKPLLDLQTQKEQIRKARKARRNSQSVPSDSDSRHTLSYVEILKFFKDIVSGVHELHSNHIIHRDLKPSNCLVSTRYEHSEDFDMAQIDSAKYEKYSLLPNILISDFGESQFEGIRRNSTGTTGTLEYIAPELLTPESAAGASLHDFTKQSDIFGLGMILFVMCFGKLPYDSDSHDLDYSNLKSKIRNFNIEPFFHSQEFTFGFYRNDLPNEIYKLLLSITNVDASKRPLAPEILKHLNELILKELQQEPAENEQATSESSSHLDAADEKILLEPVNDTQYLIMAKNLFAARTPGLTVSLVICRVLLMLIQVKFMSFLNANYYVLPVNPDSEHKMIFVNCFILGSTVALDLRTGIALVSLLMVAETFIIWKS